MVAFIAGGAARQRKIRVRMFLAQYGCCALCGGQMFRNVYPLSAAYPTFDHKIPRSRGGSNRLENLHLAHRECNEERSDMLLEDWFRTRPALRRRVELALRIAA